jgi:leucyl aminopeptidase
MTWKISGASPWRTKADALLVPVVRLDGKVRAAAEPEDPAAARLLAATLVRHDLSDESSGPVCVPTWGRLPAAHVVLVRVDGAGGSPAFLFERAVAAASRLCRRLKLQSLVVGVPDVFDGSAAEAVRRIVRGAATGSEQFDVFKSSPAGTAAPSVTIAGARPTAALRHAAASAATEAEILGDVRRLANLPGRDATPEFIARECRRMARRHGFACRVHDRAALERMGCRALLAVGQGSRNEPRMTVLTWRGAGRAKPVALVGKTLTFDSGGISLKPGKGMEWMRYDKSGGMAVLVAVATAAALRLPVNVTGILAAAENLPDGGATRPGDIVRARNGTTIEILNTDAEGRLVLADALSVAADLKPAAIVDLATLTGAVIVALGHHVSALLGSDDALGTRLREAGEASGERLWPLPLWPEYDRQLRSDFADLPNIGEGGAGTIIGAAFLKRFVPAGVPWAHVDIAGTAWDEKPSPHRGAGATLVGARLLVEWLGRGAPVA